MATTLGSFLRENPDVTISLVTQLWDERTAVAATVMESLSTWAAFEVELTIFVADHIAKTDFRIVSELLADTTWSRRRKIIASLADATLDENHRKGFAAMLKKADAAAQNRHEFVHGIWGIMEERPDLLVLVPPKAIVRAAVSGETMPAIPDLFSGEGHRTLPFERGDELCKLAKVLTEEDLSEAKFGVTLAHILLKALSLSLTPGSSIRVTAKAPEAEQ